MVIIHIYQQLLTPYWIIYCAHFTWYNQSTYLGSQIPSVSITAALNIHREVRCFSTSHVT
jgi:hypothetical protein